MFNSPISAQQQQPTSKAQVLRALITLYQNAQDSDKVMYQTLAMTAFQGMTPEEQLSALQTGELSGGLLSSVMNSTSSPPSAATNTTAPDGLLHAPNQCDETGVDDNTDRPAESRFRTVLCKHFKNGFCKNGDRCCFAHGESQLRRPAAQPPHRDPAAGVSQRQQQQQERPPAYSTVNPSAKAAVRAGSSDRLSHSLLRVPGRSNNSNNTNNNAYDDSCSPFARGDDEASRRKKPHASLGGSSKLMFFSEPHASQSATQRSEAQQIGGVVHMDDGAHDSSIQFRTVLCKHYRSGKCLLGNSCCFAHGTSKLRTAAQNMKDHLVTTERVETFLKLEATREALAQSSPSAKDKAVMNSVRTRLSDTHHHFRHRELAQSLWEIWNVLSEKRQKLLSRTSGMMSEEQMRAFYDDYKNLAAELKKIEI